MLELHEDASRHIIQVLRMQEGAELQLTDGKGGRVTARISTAHKRHASVQVVSHAAIAQPAVHNAIAISLLKNTTRFEWFLEKVTEMGIRELFPLLAERTEKQRVRMDRLQTIVVSAMLQSQQAWLPVLHEPASFSDFIKGALGDFGAEGRFIAHCMEGNKKLLKEAVLGAPQKRIVLIGPEGDFSPAELTTALAHGCSPVSLGDTRLRTETAGMVAGVMLTY